ncbi:Adenylyl-sulfate kinase 2 [Sulfurimonas gotlandica GD1]|uniref:Adenylyl-sulfate kinase n=1 Tax=Sulfurimonas gotlandica (strain DSM 19862 / JCM 16533 / GD1) TaxID=929558 RepID=B6BKH3_SULGG|nr:adenylyl-sulfate kinase [Sulfurimonas gotlandica]EDZ62343.1 adenylylsulfate kinase [Sulfurimonas gotlandica GD1]EHP29028.1 Adenylyl-sulfate kinase 2 [Sulfurimonas gotlandica GD1]
MFKETNARSLFKGISWRILATTTTIILVYMFFNRLDLAIIAGIIETILKVALYWGHERVWHKIRWGKKRIEPFNLWFTGLPLSGKTTIADAVFKELNKLQIPIERLDSKDIRDVVPDIGFSRKDRNIHMKRIGHLIKTLQNNSISTVASFVSPYRESRKTIREMVKNNIVVYIKANIETCKKRDRKGKYEKATKGEYQNFTGVNDIYEEPQHAEITIDTDKLSVDEATKIIVKYVKKNYVK